MNVNWNGKIMIEDSSINADNYKEYFVDDFELTKPMYDAMMSDNNPAGMKGLPADFLKPKYREAVINNITSGVRPFRCHLPKYDFQVKLTVDGSAVPIGELYHIFDSRTVKAIRKSIAYDILENSAESGRLTDLMPARS